MKLSFSRSLAEMKEVLLDPDAKGPDPVYEVFTDLGDHFWINKTVLTSGRYGKEYPKTFGHYHNHDVDEVYYVVDGEGVLLLQKRDATEVFLVRAKTGDRVVIHPEYGHSWSNVGGKPLVLFDNWSTPHSPTDYAKIENMAGMAYYLVEENGEVKAVADKNYPKMPAPRWLTAAEFNAQN